MPSTHARRLRAAQVVAMFTLTTTGMGCDREAQGTFDVQLSGRVNANVKGSVTSHYTSRFSTGALARHYEILLAFPPTVKGLDGGFGARLMLGIPEIPETGRYQIVTLKDGEKSQKTVWSLFGGPTTMWYPANGTVEIRRGRFGSNGIEATFDTKMIARNGDIDTVFVRGHVKTQ